MSAYTDDVLARRAKTYPLESREDRERYRAQLEALEQTAVETRALVAEAREPAMISIPANSEYAIAYQRRLGVDAPVHWRDQIVEYDGNGNMTSGSAEMRARAAAANADARARQQAWLDAHEVKGTGLFRAYATGPLDRPPRS